MNNKTDSSAEGHISPFEAIKRISDQGSEYWSAREIAEVLNIPEGTLRDWFSRGAPFSRDDHHHLWVHGQHFAEWVDVQRKSKHRSPRKLKEGEGYCMRCNQIVALVDPIIHHIKGKLYHTKGQ